MRLFAIPLIIAGIFLSIVSLTPDVDLVGEDFLQGIAIPGDSSRPLEGPEYGSLAFTSEDLPCALFIYPLNGPEHSDYLTGEGLPSRRLDCDTPSLSVGHQVSYLVLRNLDPFDSMNYSLQVTFYRSLQPLAWVSVPALGLLLTGTTVAVFWLLTRGIEGIWKEYESEENSELPSERRK